MINKIPKEAICLENTSDNPKYDGCIVQPLDAMNFQRKLDSTRRYSVVKIYSHLWRGWQFIEQAFEKLAEKYPKVKFFELHTATEGVPIVRF